MARLWEKLIWAALCGTALGFGGCKPASKAQKPPPQPVVEAPPDAAPAADAAADASSAVDPDEEGVAVPLDDASTVDAADAGEAAAPDSAARKKKKGKTALDLGPGFGGVSGKKALSGEMGGYGPPPTID